MSGKYDFNLNLTEDTMDYKFLSRITPSSAVLEFGCASGRMTSYLHLELGCAVDVIEINPEDLKIASAYADKAVCADVDTMSWLPELEGCRYDYILFTDVLEHLKYPEAALKAVKPLLKENGEILISVPNIAHNDIVAKLFDNSFDYTEIGLLDNTHIHFWGKNNLEEFAVEAGYAVSVLDAVCRKAFTMEQYPDFIEGPGRNISDVLYGREYNEVYQYFMVLVKSEYAKQAHTATEDLTGKHRFSQFRSLFYWGTGSGFDEKNRQFAAPVAGANGRYTYRVDSVPEYCSRVIFQPFETAKGLLINNIEIQADMRHCACYNTNGLLLDDVTGFYAFADLASQISFEIPQGTGVISLSLDICICDSGEVRKLIRQYKDARVDREEYSRLVASVEEFARNYSGLAEEKHKLQAEKDSISAQNLSLREENVSLYAEKQEMAAETDELRQTIADLTGHLEASGSRIVQLQNEVCEKEQHLTEHSMALKEIYSSNS